VADRLEGALRAFERAGRPAGDLHMIDVGALNVAAGQKAGADIAALAPADRPTAVFCTNDLIALGVLQEMTRHKIRVPEDISIVGYDDIDFAAAAAVPLTSVRQPRQQLGRTAARMLLEEAAAGDNHQHQQVIFEPELIVRQSTKATPAPRRAAPAGRLPAGDGGQLLTAATHRTCLAGRPAAHSRTILARPRPRASAPPGNDIRRGIQA
jgi:LacI family transcriptional regulator